MGKKIQVPPSLRGTNQLLMLHTTQNILLSCGRIHQHNPTIMILMMSSRMNTRIFCPSQAVMIQRDYLTAASSSRMHFLLPVKNCCRLTMCSSSAIYTIILKNAGSGISTRTLRLPKKRLLSLPITAGSKPPGSITVYTSLKPY